MEKKKINATIFLVGHVMLGLTNCMTLENKRNRKTTIIKKQNTILYVVVVIVVVAVFNNNFFFCFFFSFFFFLLTLNTVSIQRQKIASMAEIIVAAKVEVGCWLKRNQTSAITLVWADNFRQTATKIEIILRFFFLLFCFAILSENFWFRCRLIFKDYCVKWGNDKRLEKP